ncbi:DUF1918 domain-containing protein [Cryobacterium frigoriphilum]|uniref:DUF1918 domain-containing protein n=1 Tax=Cryobacterium frigoriphilum TaxID=1259150 RepID=A0A4R8ZTH7_9MICO|nr:DUF1918 domain-containing protein [Cryobacterium frigoriphilum]TFD45178.1 DUF1918 domain-containing protein [Cryobacterium frigoriphilum]
MRATQGDRIVIRGKSVGNPDRHGEILDVRGEDGGPPYEVRFHDGHRSVVYPGSDFIIEHVSAEESV